MPSPTFSTLPSVDSSAKLTAHSGALPVRSHLPSVGLRNFAPHMAPEPPSPWPKNWHRPADTLAPPDKPFMRASLAMTVATPMLASVQDEALAIAAVIFVNSVSRLRRAVPRHRRPW